jgi:hypothetical protein
MQGQPYGAKAVSQIINDDGSGSDMQIKMRQNRWFCA